SQPNPCGRRGRRPTVEGRNGGGMATVTAPSSPVLSSPVLSDEELRRWSPGQRRALARRLAALDRPEQTARYGRATRYGRVAVIGVTALLCAGLLGWASRLATILPSRYVVGHRDPLWAKLLIAAGALLVLASAGVLVVEKLVAHTVNSRIPQTNLLGTPGPGQVAPAHASIDGAVNILLVGIDERVDQPATDPSRADSIIVLHVPVTHDRAYLVSIPRDTLVDIPADSAAGYRGGSDKINAAYSVGSSHGLGQ